MSETLNDYIRGVKTYSTFLARSRHPHVTTKVPHQVTSLLDLLTPLRPKTDPPK